MTIARKTLPEQTYLYVEREAALTGPAMAEAMGSGFGEVYGFCQANGIEPVSMPSTIYLAMPAGDTVAFRTAMFVSADDAGKASGSVLAATIPAGEAFTTTHVGAYANLNQSHQAVWRAMEEAGATPGMPVWEIYVDDPTMVPEESLRTEIFRAVG